MNSLYFTGALIFSIIIILLGLFALVMALIRFIKAKNTSDPQAKAVETKKSVSTIIAAIFLFFVGFGALLAGLFLFR